MKSGELLSVYKRLYGAFGPQGWWPAKTPFEVAVGAILTQNTSWSNVEKAIASLRKHRLLQAGRMSKTPNRRLAELIRPAGYYNLKALRLKSFLDFLDREAAGDIRRLSRLDTGLLRKRLLGVKGIGPETADSIALYAVGKPVFVVDNYTRRIFSRHGMVRSDAKYEEVQRLFTASLDPDARIFNEYHALLVKLAKDYCRKSKPRCLVCPLAGWKGNKKKK